MARSAGGTTRLLMVFLLILSCAALLLGIWLVESVPSRAAQLFGPPAPHLGLMQRWNLFRTDVEASIAQQCGLVPWQKVRLGVSMLEHAGLVGAAATWVHQFGEQHDI